MPTAAVAASTHIIGITNYKARYHFDEKMNIRSYFPFSYGVCFLRVRCARLPTRIYIHTFKNKTHECRVFVTRRRFHIYLNIFRVVLFFCTTIYVLIIVFMLECGGSLGCSLYYIELLLRSLNWRIVGYYILLWMISENGQYISIYQFLIIN